MAAEKILVIGGAGFIGANTVKHLLAEGKSVLVLDNLSSGNLLNLPMQHTNLEFIEGDVLEFFLVQDLLKACDAVLHLAAIASVGATIENPLYSLQVNTLGLLHVLQAVLLSKRQIPIVYASSAAVYGNEKNLPCRDDKLLSIPASSPYSLQKMHAEHYADLYFRMYGIKSLGLRYFNVYGQGQDPASVYSGVISKFLQAYAQQQALIIFGDGKQSRDFIHIADVARANSLALTSNYAGVVNIATGVPNTLLQLIDCIQNPSQPAQIKFLPERPGDIHSSYGSTELAKTALGFTAGVSLAQGIAALKSTASS